MRLNSGRWKNYRYCRLYDSTIPDTVYLHREIYTGLMIPLLAYPLALIALAALPALAAIYLLRNRFRAHPVSSLILWRTEARLRQGGSRIRQFQMPLLFFIELAILALLVAAAVNPLWIPARNKFPLVVVLDDSASMRAGDTLSLIHI